MHIKQPAVTLIKAQCFVTCEHWQENHATVDLSYGSCRDESGVDLIIRINVSYRDVKSIGQSILEKCEHVEWERSHTARNTIAHLITRKLGPYRARQSVAAKTSD